MRILILSVLLTWGPVARAHLRPGLDPAEARDLSALCTTHTFNDLYGDDAAIIPAGYQRNKERIISFFQKDTVR